MQPSQLPVMASILFAFATINAAAAYAMWGERGERNRAAIRALASRS